MISPVSLGRWPISTRCGWPSGGAWTRIDSRSRAAFGVGRARRRARLRRIVTSWPAKPCASELGLEPDQVVDEDDVVDEEVGQLEVAGRLGVAQADRVERHPLARGELGGLGQRLAVGRLAVGQEDDRRRGSAAELGQDLADPVAEPGLAAGRPRPCGASSSAGVDVLGLVDLGQQPARASRRGRAAPCSASAARGGACPSS